MVTIKFETEKIDKGRFVVLPTILFDGSEKAAKARILIGFAWLRGLFTIDIRWGQKEENCGEWE